MTPAALHITVDQIGPAGLDVAEALPCAYLRELFGSDGEFVPCQDGRIEAHVSRVEDALTLRGTAHITMQAACGRCLAPARLAMHTSLALAVVPRQQEPAAGEDGELTDEDLGVATYADNFFDLAATLRDEVVLELPMRALCTASCAGLCASCGTNRNTSPCRCAAPTDVRWAALEQIKLG